MAGDWIKWGCGLTTKREILEIASRLLIAPAHAAGCLMLAMEWVDQNVTDFESETCHAFVTLRCCPPNILDNIVGVAGFTEAMAEAGWLTRKGDVLCFVHAGRYNGNSAKCRALASARQSMHRITQMSRSKRDNSVTREEKRREEIIHAAKTPRERNPLFDAIAETTGINPAVAGGEIGRALAMIKAETADVTPDEIRRRFAALQKLQPDCSHGPMALAKWWGKCGQVVPVPKPRQVYIPTIKEVEADERAAQQP